MAKTKKSMRALAFIITVMMIACLAPTVSFAANTVTMDDIVADGNSITVGGSIEKGAELTMLAVRANAELTSLSGMSDADLEKAIMYIDQVTMGDEKYTKTFELRDTAAGNVITVFMGGTDAAMVYKSYKMLAAAGTVTINGTDFVEGAAEQPKLTISDDTWFATLDKVVYVKGDASKTPAGNVAADGTITIDTPSNEKTTYVVELTTPASSDYAAFTKTFEFSYITADGDKISKLPANLGVTVDKDSDASKYTITVPADDNGIVYSATVDGTVQALTSRTFDVERPADDGNAETTLKKTVVVTATAGTATKTYTIEVLEQGAAAPAIKDTEITFIGEDVYDKAGMVLVIVKTEAEVDISKESVKVGDVTLFYVKDKGYFVGIVPAYASAADAAAVAEIVATPSEVIRYGKASDAEDINDPYDSGDFAEVKKIALAKIAAPTDKQLISCDVCGDLDNEMDGAVDSADFAIVKKAALGKIDDLPINK